MYILDELLAKTVELGASDLHLTVGIPPTVRLNGKLMPLGDEKLTQPMIEGFAEDILGKKFEEYNQIGEADTSYSKKGVGRFRVNVFKQRNSDAIALRVISLKVPTLDQLKHPNIVKELVTKQRGLVLVTGPTGSGKTSTLYSILKDVNNEENNVITIEDPVEYSMDEIVQVNVNNKAGLTFASGLRSILRQDPDVIMVGEIRDEETATMAIRAAITGHSVLSTLHTNDAPSAIIRLLDMNIPAYLIASSLTGVIAQRLIRTLCPSCKEEYNASKTDIEALGIKDSEELKLYKPVGCPKCNGLGYKGRKAIFEIMDITDNIRDMISNKNSIVDIRKEAKNSGMDTLFESAKEDVLKGITSVEELMRVTLIKE